MKLDHGEPMNADEILPAPPHDPRWTMAGSPEQAANEIAEVGVEGRPVDAKGGPRWVWGELGAAVAIVVCLTGVLGWVMGWAAGVVALAFSMIALILNPVVVTTIIRAHDRQIVVHRHDGDRQDSPKAEGDKEQEVQVHSPW